MIWGGISIVNGEYKLGKSQNPHLKWMRTGVKALELVVWVDEWGLYLLQYISIGDGDDIIVIDLCKI